MARRFVSPLMLAAGLALGIAAVATGRRYPGWWFAGESDVAAALELVAGVVLIAASVVARRRHPASRFGPLLAAAGLAWFVTEFNNPELGSSVAFTAGLALVAACPPLVAHAALAYPGGRLRSRAERVAVSLAYLLSLGMVGVLPALVFDPAAVGCADCPRNLLLVSAEGDLAEDFARLGLQLGPLWAGVLLALGAMRVARASVAERRLTLPVLLPAGAYLVAIAWLFWRSADRGFLGTESVDLSLWVAQAAALCLLAGGASWEWVRSRRTRSALAALVLDLERSPGPGGLRAALARRLADRSLELLYRLPDGRLVSAAGAESAPGPDMELTPLVSGGRALAVAAHRPGLFDDANLAHEVASAARLALENERLQAELRARLEDLRASRARVVETSDAERRRLERDLHDGAQQRLVALSLALGLAVAQHKGSGAHLERAHNEVKKLLADLRELAHGIYPVALADEGLAAAVEALAEESGLDIRLDGTLPEDRLDPQVESAAYLVIRELATDERASWTQVRAQREDGRLVLEVASKGAQPRELVLLEDRVGAVGGEMRLERPPHGVTRLRAELPCA